METGLFRILGGFSFCFGACVASFLNVVIWRVPRGESIVSPPSHCPKCGAAIRWYQNVPILSWLALRGKCANCRAPISPRYIFVETLGACLFLAAFLKTWPDVALHGGAVLRLAALWIWIALMIVGSMIDYDLKLLPDFVTVGGMVLGVGEALLLTFFVESVPLFSRSSPLVVSLSGLAFGFGLLWLVRFLGSKAFRREAMGLGDVFLMGAVGALHGPVAVLFVLIFSSVFGSVFGVLGVLFSKSGLVRFTEIPYGPYICMADLLYLFCGGEIIGWYLRLLAP